MTTRRQFLTMPDSLPALITLILFAIVGRASAQDDAIFFRAGFNGAAQGMLEGESLDPTETQGLRFAPSDNSQALKIEAGPSLGYDLQHIVDYVKSGGGYVGCCQGACFAEQLKLVDVKCYAMDVWGLYNIALNAEPHFVKGGRNGTIRMHFGNGPIMVAGKDCEVLGTYALGFPTGKPAAILTGKCGKGKVVLFGTHPLGEKASYKGTRAWFSGKLMGTEKMFINALLYAAKLVDPEGVALDSDRR